MFRGPSIRATAHLRSTEPALECCGGVPTLGQRRVIAELLQLRQELLHDAKASLAGAPASVSLGVDASNLASQLESPLTCCPSLVDHLTKGGPGAIELAGVLQRIPQLHQMLQPARRVSRQERRGAGQKVDRGGDVTALIRPMASPPKQIAGTRRQSVYCIVDSAELFLQPEGLLQVVADDLVVLAAIRLEPQTEPLMQFGP